MEKDRIDRLFETLAQPVASPSGLESRVIAAVRRAELARARRVMVVHSIMFALFSVLAAWFGSSALGEMTKNGSLQILFIILTDSKVALSNIGEWGMAVLETLPLPQISIFSVLAYLAGNIGLRIVRESHPRLPLGAV